jgi:hypothetical protein
MLEKIKPVLKLRTTSSWTDHFRDLSKKNKQNAKYWFWDTFNWESQSLWVGKLNRMNHLPTTDDQIKKFLGKLIDDLGQSTYLKSAVYIKFYFSRNITTHEPDVNYLMICDTPQIPEDFESTLVDIMFEKYQLTESLISKNDDFKNMIDHYINWSNFYTYYDLMGELFF